MRIILTILLFRLPMRVNEKWEECEWGLSLNFSGELWLALFEGQVFLGFGSFSQVRICTGTCSSKSLYPAVGRMWSGKKSCKEGKRFQKILCSMITKKINYILLQKFIFLTENEAKKLSKLEKRLQLVACGEISCFYCIE